MKLEEFVNWWSGFKQAVGDAPMTREQLDILDKTIRSVERQPEIKIELSGPTKGGKEEYYIPPTWFPTLPKQQEDKPWPRLPDIWCRDNQPQYGVGTPSNPPYVGTSLKQIS